MMKNFKNMVLRFLKMMIGSTVCVALIGFASYYLSWVLNLITRYVMNFLTKSAAYLVNNWGAVIVLVVALTIGGMVFEVIFGKIKKMLQEP